MCGKSLVYGKKNTGTEEAPVLVDYTVEVTCPAGVKPYVSPEEKAEAEAKKKAEEKAEAEADAKKKAADAEKKVPDAGKAKQKAELLKE